MSYLNTSEDLFIGKTELDRLIKFLDDDGYRKNLLDNSYLFGIIKNVDDPNLNNYKVEAGTTAGTIKIANNSYALDSNGLLITKIAEDDIAIPNDSLWYWVKIKHEYSPIELGLVSVDVGGNLTGVGTEFESVLRGAPNNQVKVEFPNAVLNTDRYSIQEVSDDNNAIIDGSVSAETDLQYKVVGAFTPVVVPTANERYPFQYSSTIGMTVVDGGLVQSTGEPAKISGEEFFIARVKNIGGTVTIEDKRTEFWTTKAGFDLSYIDRDEVNPLIGIESVKWDSKFSTRENNQVIIGWGFRSSNWTQNSELRRITISSGEGGKFKNVDDFTDNDFDGWRLYAKNGTYKLITSSLKSGGQINLTLQSLDPDDYTTGDELVITQDVEEIEVRARYDGSLSEIEQINKNFLFPIRQGWGKLPLLVPASEPIDESDSGSELIPESYYYNITYRLKNHSEYTDWLTPPSDTTDGFYDETSFDQNGVLNVNPIDRTRKLYTSDDDNGYIEVVPHPDAYYRRIETIDPGDLFGVEILTMTTSLTLVTLQVGTDKKYQRIDWDDITLVGDVFFNLSKTKIDGSAIDDGNEFTLHFIGSLTSFGGQEVKIVTDYVDVSTNTLIKDYTENMNLFVSNSGDGMRLKFKYDGTNWFLVPNEEIRIKEKVLEIGDWNMDSTPELDLAHGITDHETIRDVSVMIRQDTGAGGLVRQLDSITYAGAYTSIIVNGGISRITDTIIRMQRTATSDGGLFDTTSYDSTSYNRGWVHIKYEE